MAAFPETRISLILRLAASDDALAWREFARLYAPAVYAMAIRRGLQEADAEDFVQELLLAVARAAGRWQPDEKRARFRTWLYRIATNLLTDHFRQQTRRSVHQLTMSEADEPIDDSTDLMHDFEQEFRRARFHRAAEIVKQRVSETTWRAFELTCVHSVPAQSVSSQLGMSVGNVYVARSRTMQLIRQEIEKMESCES